MSGSEHLNAFKGRDRRGVIVW